MVHATTAIIRLHLTDHGYTGRLTFNLLNEASDSFIEWCKSQEIVNVVQRSGATSLLLLLGYDSSLDSLKTALETLVAEAARLLACDIQTDVEMQELSLMEERIVDQAAHVIGPITQGVSQATSNLGGLHKQASSAPRRLRRSLPNHK